MSAVSISQSSAWPPGEIYPRLAEESSTINHTVPRIKRIKKQQEAIF